MKGIQCAQLPQSNQSQEVGDGEAARLVPGDSDDGPRWRSGTNDCSDGGGDNVRPSSKQ
jgi:hypothetical protein